MLEQGKEREAEKVKNLKDKGQELAQAGHFNAAAILKDIQEFTRRYTT